MVTTQKAREILSGQHLSDENIQQLVDQLTLFSKLLIADYLTKKKTRSLIEKAPQKPTQSTFPFRRVIGYPCRDFLEGL